MKFRRKSTIVDAIKFEYTKEGITRLRNFAGDRNYTDEERQKAIAWHGGEDAPVMFSDFKTENCGFVEVVK